MFIIINFFSLFAAYKFYKDSNSGTSRKLFRFLLLHLPLLMILFLVNKKRWFFTETKEDTKKNELVDKNVGSFIKLNLPHINASPLEASPKTV